MPRHLRPTRFASIALAALAVSASGAFAAWVEVRSPSFVVVSNASARKAQSVAAEMEQTRQAIELWFPGLEKSPTPLLLFALQTKDDMVDFTDGYVTHKDSIAGFFRHDEVRSDVVLALEFEIGTITHEYVHSVTQHSLPGMPQWLNEGFAMLWDNANLSGTKLRIGNPQRGYLRLLGESKLTSMPMLIDPDGAARLFQDSTQQSIAYGQSWALTHFLLLGNDGANWPLLLQYLERCATGADPVTTWVQAFGPPEDMEAVLWKYLNAGHLPNRILEIPSKIESSSFPTRSLTETEVEAYRGRFLAHIGRSETARAALEESLAGAENAIAHEGLGLLHLRESELTKAKEHFDAATDLDESLHVAHYLAALTEYQEAAEGWQTRAEAHVLGAIGAAPSYAPAFALYARILGTQPGKLPQAITLAKQAVAKAGGSASNHLLLASLAQQQEGSEEIASSSVGFAVHLANMSASSAMANDVCWTGSLNGLAAEVLAACETAVRRAPDAGEVIDSRAVARILIGDFDGAIEDLETVLASEVASDPDIRTSRSAWLEALKAGRDPLDDETLEGLRRASR